MHDKEKPEISPCGYQLVSWWNYKKAIRKTKVNCIKHNNNCGWLINVNQIINNNKLETI